MLSEGAREGAWGGRGETMLIEGRGHGGGTCRTSPRKFVAAFTAACFFRISRCSGLSRLFCSLPPATRLNTLFPPWPAQPDD